MQETILLVEDEAKIARPLRLYLEQAGYEVTTVDDGALAMPAFRAGHPDLVLLDLALPHVDWWELCRQIRQSSAVPIIMLTARSEETDRIVGLELGADDYISKSFSPREVVARVRAVLRRTQGQVQTEAPGGSQLGGVLVQTGGHTVLWQRLRIHCCRQTLLDITPRIVLRSFGSNYRCSEKES